MKPRNITVEGGEHLEHSGARGGGYRDLAKVERAPLKLTLRQVDRRFWFAGVFALAWDAMCVFLCHRGLGDEGSAPGWFLWLFLGSGALITVTTIWLFAIRVTVLVTAQSISVQQRSASDILRTTQTELIVPALARLHVAPSLREDGTINEKPFYTTVYQLYAILNTGGRKLLVSDIMRESHARFLQKVIEEYLSIPPL